jgi:D-alanyl-D-alanine-carboxypeptidase/D-alanyl-D-alanine-endopeptidase
MKIAASLRSITVLVMLAFPIRSAVAESTEAKPSGALCFSDAFKSRIESGLAGYADVAGIPGVSVGVVTPDAPVYTASVGQARRSEARAASSDTLYNVASVTKVFTATLALMLVEDGLLSLDASIATYLPETVSVPKDATGGEITLRHLLSHTSGLPRDPPNRRNLDPQGAIDPGIWDAYDVANLHAALAATKIERKVGEKYEYSNYGYALLGHVLETVSKKPFERLLRERLLEPLEMTDTAITLGPKQERRLAAFHWSEDPERKERAVRARYGDVAAFIGLSSSVDDLARFVAAHLQRVDGTSAPVSSFVRTSMGEARAETYADAVYRVEIGLGWFRETRLDDGSVIQFHPGEVDGHTSGLFLAPTLGLGVVVLQNLGGDGGAQGIDAIGHWLLGAAANELRTAGDCKSGSAVTR